MWLVNCPLYTTACYIRLIYLCWWIHLRCISTGGRKQYLIKSVRWCPTMEFLLLVIRLGLTYMTTFKNHGIPGGIQGYVRQLDSCCPKSTLHITHCLPIGYIITHLRKSTMRLNCQVDTSDCCCRDLSRWPQNSSRWWRTYGAEISKPSINEDTYVVSYTTWLEKKTVPKLWNIKNGKMATFKRLRDIVQNSNKQHSSSCCEL